MTARQESRSRRGGSAASYPPVATLGEIVDTQSSAVNQRESVRIQIRRAQPKDLETIVAFNARLAEESEGVRLDWARLRSGVEALLRDETRGFYLLAESDGSPIGQLALSYEWSDWRNGLFWWLQSVYVRPEYRRQGVLNALYERVLELAKGRNVCGIRLYVERNNLGAQAAYRRLGLEPTVFEMYERDFVIERDAHSK